MRLGYKEFDDTIIITILTGIFGALAITWVFVWQEIDKQTIINNFYNILYSVVKVDDEELADVTGQVYLVGPGIIEFDSPIPKYKNKIDEKEIVYIINLDNNKKIEIYTDENGFFETKLEEGSYVFSLGTGYQDEVDIKSQNINEVELFIQMPSTAPQY